MTGKSSPVARSVLLYAAAFGVAGATPFILLPILTQALSPREFGEATFFLILVTMVGNVAGLSAHGFVSVRYFKVPAGQFKSIVSSSAIAILSAHAIVALVALVGFPRFGYRFELPLGLVLLAVATAAMSSLNLVFLAIYQSSTRPVLYLSSRLVQGTMEIALCIALVLLVRHDSGARIFSFSAAMASSVLLGIVVCHRAGYLGLNASGRQTRALLAFGLPLIPHIFAGTAITYLDRMMVSTLQGVDSLGIYMVGMQFGMAMMVVVEPLNKALAPWLFEQLRRNDDSVKATVVRKTYAFYAGLTFVGAAVAGLSHVLFDRIIDARYAGAKPLIALMIAGFVFQGMYYSVVNYLFYAEKTGRLSVASSMTAVAGCGASYVLISNFGMIGAGLSFALNNLLLFLIVWLIAARVVPMPWLPRKLA